MTRERVIIVEKIDDSGIDLLKSKFDVDLKIDMTREELLDVIQDYDAIIVRSATLVNSELMEKGKRLKIIGRAGNGIDNIDIPEATKRGIIVANTPDSNSISAGELAIGLMFAQARNITKADKSMREGRWDRNKFEGTELYGKTLGIIGLGRIGSLVATRMKAFGMDAIAYDPYITDERFEQYDVKKCETLDELLKIADFITIHTPRTEETIGMISYNEIEMMKKGVHITNAARGKIIDEKAAYEGLKNGKIGSMGLDVHEKEPRHESPLYEFDNVVVTPHIGANTVSAQQNVGKTIAMQVINGIRGEIVPNAVNLPVIHRDELKAVKPYIDMMEKIGKLYYQLFKDAVKFVEINYWADASKFDVDMVNIAFLKGLLEPIKKDKVNYINAKVLAKKSGIGIKFKKYEENYNNYSNLINVKITDVNMKQYTFSGAISMKREGILVEMNGYKMDVTPSEKMIILKNKDVPGVIGKVGTLTGKDGINVATMHVGRKTKGDTALMILNVDEAVSKDAIKDFVKLDEILWARAIEL